MTPATETACVNHYFDLKFLADDRDIHGKLDFREHSRGLVDAQVNGRTLLSFDKREPWMFYLQGKEV